VAMAEKSGRAATTALIGAGMFGLVPQPMACLEPYRRDDRLTARSFAEDDGPPVRGVREATTQEQIAQTRRKLESAGMGGSVR
jgi:hypothetical protein